MASISFLRLEEASLDLRQICKSELLSEEEAKLIIKKRRSYEHLIGKNITFDRFQEYLAYEIDLLDSLRDKANQFKMKRKVIQPQIRWIYSLFEQGTRKFNLLKDFWIRFLSFSKNFGSSKATSRIFSRSLQLLPYEVTLWIDYVEWETNTNSNYVSARGNQIFLGILQKAVRYNENSKDLWLKFLSFEIDFVEKLLKRRDALGIENKESCKNSEDSEMVLSGGLVSVVSKQASKCIILFFRCFVRRNFTNRQHVCP